MTTVLILIGVNAALLGLNVLAWRRLFREASAVKVMADDVQYHARAFVLQNDRTVAALMEWRRSLERFKAELVRYAQSHQLPAPTTAADPAVFPRQES